MEPDVQPPSPSPFAPRPGQSNNNWGAPSQPTNSQPASGQPAPSQAPLGQPAPGFPTLAQGVGGQLAADQPGYSQSASNLPGRVGQEAGQVQGLGIAAEPGFAESGYPAPGFPTPAQGVGGQLAADQSGHSQLAPNQPGQQPAHQPGHRQPPPGQAPLGQPAPSQAPLGQPSLNQPGHSQPAPSQPGQLGQQTSRAQDWGIPAQRGPAHPAQPGPAQPANPTHQTHQASYAQTAPPTQPAPTMGTGVAYAPPSPDLIAQQGVGTNTVMPELVSVPMRMISRLASLFVIGFVVGLASSILVAIDNEIVMIIIVSFPLMLNGLQFFDPTLDGFTHLQMGILLAYIIVYYFAEAVIVRMFSANIYKMIFNSRIVDAKTAAPITFRQAVIRASVPAVPFVLGVIAVWTSNSLELPIHEGASLLFLGSLLVMAVVNFVVMIKSPYNQGIHDRIAGTIVVKRTKSKELS